MWLCKLIGHKHIKSTCCYASFHPDFCLRCLSGEITKEGDGMLVCALLGHHSTAAITGDFESQDWSANFCFRCHASVDYHG